MALISSADYGFIRKRIDASLNESSLPDSIIESYEVEAAEWVEERVTDLDDIAESAAAADVKRYGHARRAALYYLASLIAPTVNIPTSDAGIAGASYTRKVMEPGANAARLLEKALEEVGLAAKPEVSSDSLMPTFFAAAPGGRGR